MNATAIKGPQREEAVSVLDGRIDLHFKIAGNGPPVVYLHSAAGLYWDAFVDRLADDHTVYAPELPGTSVGVPYAIHEVHDYWTLLLLYEEALTRLGLQRPAAVGQSMGGMMVLDLAANFRGLFDRLVALAPAGLWRDDAPNRLADLYAAAPENVPGFLFNDPNHPGAQELFALPEDPEQIPQAIAAHTWALGCAGKFLWPLADQGLERRLYRVDNPSLIVWGRNDALIPVALAQEFAERLKNGRVEIIDECGHLPAIEQFDQTFDLVTSFID
jgi:pimeloyl-ACP methyl ester carboxylesterase